MRFLSNDTLTHGHNIVKHNIAVAKRLKSLQEPMAVS
jgi:hypothetical protein